MMLGRTLILAAMAVTAAATVQAQQMPLVYVLHDAPRPGCPGLVLHLRVDARTITGFASYDDMKGMSRVVGTRNEVGHFNMTLKPIDPTGPKGTIEGDSNNQSAAIRSVLKGAGCNDGPLTINTLSITNGKS